MIRHSQRRPITIVKSDNEDKHVKTNKIGDKVHQFLESRLAVEENADLETIKEEVVIEKLNTNEEEKIVEKEEEVKKEKKDKKTTKE